MGSPAGGPQAVCHRVCLAVTMDSSSYTPALWSQRRAHAASWLLCGQYSQPHYGDGAFGFLPTRCFNGPFSVWGHRPVGVLEVCGVIFSVSVIGVVLTSSEWEAGMLTSLPSGTDHTTMMAPEATGALVRSPALIALVTPVGSVQLFLF